MQSTAIDTDRCRELATDFISFLETGVAPERLFAPDVFVDFTLPLWRMQTGNAEDAVAMRRAAHASAGKIGRPRYDRTERGFVLEAEETWDDDGESWYCREMFRADVVDGSIAELSVYCTGDWDSARMAEHRAAVSLLRP
jgi:hypothetical protein